MTDAIKEIKGYKGLHIKEKSEDDDTLGSHRVYRLVQNRYWYEKDCETLLFIRTRSIVEENDRRHTKNFETNIEVFHEKTFGDKIYKGKYLLLEEIIAVVHGRYNETVSRICLSFGLYIDKDFIEKEKDAYVQLGISEKYTDYPNDDEIKELHKKLAENKNKRSSYAKHF